MKRYVAAMVVALLILSAAGPRPASCGRGTVVSADGTSIHYSSAGTGTPALVFVHGWCCDESYWRYQVPYFAGRYTVVTVDLAGHGSSAAGRDRYTMEAYGEDVAAVVDTLGLDSVILVGHSMGGRVNLEAALRLPGRVLALVGVDTYQDFEMQFPQAQVEQFLTAFSGDFAATTRGYVKTLFPATADSALVRTIIADMAAAPPAVGIGSMRSALTYDPVSTLNKLDLPVYCINSDRYPANEAAGKRHAKSYQVALMPGLGHFVMLEDPETFNDLLDATIRSIEAYGAVK